MTRFVLPLFDRFRVQIELTGVDYPSFRAILETKLLLDTMRKSPMLRQLTGKHGLNAFHMTLLLYLFFGVFTGPLVLFVESPLVSLTMIQSFTIVMLAMSLIADFSSVLLDTSDHDILGPRPVSTRTILAARIAHVIVYLSLISLSLSLVTFITGAVEFGLWFVPVFAATLALSALFIVGIVIVLYLLIMRLVSEERLRDLILYVQIAMTIAVVGMYQVMPRLLDMEQLKDLDISGRTFIYYYPPTWFAGPVDLAFGSIAQPQIVLSLLALVVPVLLFAAVVWLAPGFRTAETERAEPSRTKAERRAKSSLARLLGRWLTGRGAERAAFEWTWNLCDRSRGFKLRVYPSVAFVLVFGFAMLLIRADDLEATFTALPTTSRHLFLLYFAAMLFPISSAEMRYTDFGSAAWIYRTLPIGRPGDVLIGGLKAVALRFGVPAFLFVSLVVLAIWGFSVLLDIAFAGCVGLMLALIVNLGEAERGLPFSIQAPTAQRSGRQVQSLLLMLLASVFGVVHFGLRTFVSPLAVLPALLVVAVAMFVLMRRIAVTAWERIELPKS